MVVNKHGSFYLRNGWGTKIIQAVSEDDAIFSPQNEQIAVDNIGLGRVMIKALRYWSDAIGLTVEEKNAAGNIVKRRTHLFELIDAHDRYFQREGSLLLMQRNLASNKENATAWYWAFNEFSKTAFSKEEFVDGFYSFLSVNNVHVKRAAVEKEYNCFKNTYVSNDRKIDKTTIMDEDTYPFLAPLHLLRVNEEKKIEKVYLTKRDIPVEILIYSIASDNEDESMNGKQVSIDKLTESPLQVGKYFNIRYSKLIEMLMEAENKKLIALNNNFGNRFIEFLDIDYNQLLEDYFTDGEM